MTTQQPTSAPTLRLLAPGRIAPRGWLRDQLRLQARGLTGRLEEIWPDVGPDSGWRGGKGESWERGPYYLDGLVPLAHVLGDERLIARTRPWIEWMLASQRDDGDFGPASNDDWWPRMVALKALTQHADATGDARVEPFLRRYASCQQAHLPLRPLRKWAVARGAEAVLNLRWLHRRTGDDSLREVARLVFSQTAPWERYVLEELIRAPATTFSHMTHVVNVAMAIKQPALRDWAEGRKDGARVARAMLDALDEAHGQPQGMFSGDEWLAGRSPHHGVELCAVVELMFSLALLAEHALDGAFGDRLEKVAFNALAATLTDDMTAHQYHQQPNQVMATIARRDWTYSSDAANTFGFEPHFGCCTANLHQGWPKFAMHLWMQDADGGLAAIAYAPARVAGDALSLEVETDYPFEETVRIRVLAAAPGARALRLRLPAWCEAPRASLDGMDLPLAAADGYATLRRQWRAAEVLELVLPQPLRVAPRPNGAVSFEIGPLVMALSPGEVWREIPDSPGLGDWEATPRRSWNYAVELPEAARRLDAPVLRRPVGARPFALAGAPVEARIQARFLKSWTLQDNSAAPPPPSPVRTDLPPRMATLVPYGCARLRICEFPRLDPQDWGGYDF
ncbi:MAG: glycoside hydrolase family 127 protein [Methylobacteriaceae bacterium]|nr:glycoside hydrolase family 127 protein [Methylobacteriaceae bacterium]